MFNSLPLAKWLLIFFFYTGYIVPLYNAMPLEQERTDVWTLGHYGASYITADMIHKHTKLNTEQSAIASFTLFWLYENLIDGTYFEDPRGASRSDIGANLWGVLTWYINTKTSKRIKVRKNDKAIIVTVNFKF